MRTINDIMKEFSKIVELEEQTSSQIFNQVSLFIYYLESKKSDPDLYLLAKILDHKNYIRLVEYKGGEVLNIPKKSELKMCDILSTCYYLKEFHNFNWEEIFNFLKESNVDLDESINPYTLGRKINRIKKSMQSSLKESVKYMSLEELKDELHEK